MKRVSGAFSHFEVTPTRITMYFPPGTHIRIHPLLDWTEINILRGILSAAQGRKDPERFRRQPRDGGTAG